MTTGRKGRIGIEVVGDDAARPAKEPVGAGSMALNGVNTR